MAQITVSVTMSKTVSQLDATTINAILTWIKQNIIDKLPADSSVVYNLTLIP